MQGVATCAVNKEWCNDECARADGKRGRVDVLVRIRNKSDWVELLHHPS